MVQVAIVQVIDMIAVHNGSVAAARAVFVIVMLVDVTVRHVGTSIKFLKLDRDSQYSRFSETR
ncbi:hypothetical protein GCM10007052_12100 [Halioglobus japonicus]|nr:hypothetical protein GCM10007052_12100 [Halioglobus japonicus]